MRLFFRMAVLAIAVVGFASSLAFAAPSCTWSTQSDGSQYGVCVGDDGRTFCVSCPADDGPCSRVICS